MSSCRLLVFGVLLIVQVSAMMFSSWTKVSTTDATAMTIFANVLSELGTRYENAITSAMVTRVIKMNIQFK